MAFDFGIWNRVVLAVYAYVGPYMIRHMIRRRQRKLMTVKDEEVVVGRDSVKQE